MKDWRIIQGDALEVLRTLEDESVHCCVTSPPYWGLRDYGVKPTVWGGDENHKHEWGDIVRVNATNHTDKRRWQHTRNGRDEEAPIEKRVAWLRSQVNQGAFCQCGAWRGSLGLEPTPEMYVEHLVEIFREVRRVLRGDGTVWLNLGDCYATGAGKVGDCPGGGEQGERWKGYRGTHTTDSSGLQAYRMADGGHTQPNRMPLPGLKPKDLVGIPWRVAFALQADGWWLRSDIIWEKTNPMPESVTDRPTKAHEYIFLLAKSERYWYDADAIREDAAEDTLARYERGRSQNHKWSDGGPGNQTCEVTLDHMIGKDGRNKRSVWTIATQPYPEAHFATFPPKLIEPCILAGCPVGGTVLDPFCGTGTALMVALRLNRAAIGIELNPEYIEMATRRIEPPLFNKVS